MDELLDEYTIFINLNFDKLKDLITSENPIEFRDEKPNLLNHFLESNNDKATFVNIIARLAEKAKDEINKRAPFEEALTIHRYEVGNQSSDQATKEMDNWRNYIEVEKSGGNYHKVVMLYKRMLIPYFDHFLIWKEYTVIPFAIFPLCYSPCKISQHFSCPLSFKATDRLMYQVFALEFFFFHLKNSIKNKDLYKY